MAGTSWTRSWRGFCVSPACVLSGEGSSRRSHKRSERNGRLQMSTGMWRGTVDIAMAAQQLAFRLKDCVGLQGLEEIKTLWPCARHHIALPQSLSNCPWSGSRRRGAPNEDPRLLCVCKNCPHKNDSPDFEQARIAYHQSSGQSKAELRMNASFPTAIILWPRSKSLLRFHAPLG